MGDRDSLRNIEPLPWGTHLCQLYASREDLLEAVIPYFGGGLRRNEACLWVTAGPLQAREARELLAGAAPQFSVSLARGQIEIRDAAEWYTRDGRFDAAQVLKAWADREEHALVHGYSGLRVAGDTSWVHEAGWEDFLDYERQVNVSLRGKRMITLCTCCREQRSERDVSALMSHHDFALIQAADGGERVPASGGGGQDAGTPTSPATLGDVLYAKKPASVASEREWVELVRSIAAGDQLALHALYERTHRPVYTLAIRITGSRETAEEVTLDVFHDVWRRACGYDPVNGTVLGWIMNQARSRALDRVRHEQRKKRAGPDAPDTTDEPVADDAGDVLDAAAQGRALRAALSVLTPAEREAIEAAFFSDLTHVEVAARLKEPLGTVKTRIRSGLHKLRQALGGEEGAR